MENGHTAKFKAPLEIPFDEDPKMKEILQKLSPVVGEYYDWPKDKHKHLTIQGITFKEREGMTGIKIHFSYYNPDSQNSPLNTHTEMIWQKPEELDEPEDEQKYLSEITIGIITEFVNAAKEFRIKPKAGQLYLFEPDPEQEG
jgi:hypothetical protein